jgi:hypothetical protein
MKRLAYAAICLQKFLRRYLYLQRIKAKDPNNNTWNKSFAVLERASSTSSILGPVCEEKSLNDGANSSRTPP